MSKKKRLFGILLALPPLLLGLLYGGGYIAQFMRNYHEWEAAGGTPGNGTSPTVPSFAVSECLRAIFTMPYGIVGILICVGALVLLIVMVMRMGYSETGEYDKDRNFIYSKKGTYGTSGFMSEKEAEEIFDLRTSLKNHNGTIFGLLNGRYVCMPEESMLNKNVAVYGASDTDADEPVHIVAGFDADIDDTDDDGRQQNENCHAAEHTELLANRDRKSTRLNSSHTDSSRMPSSA